MTELHVPERRGGLGERGGQRMTLLAFVVSYKTGGLVALSFNRKRCQLTFFFHIPFTDLKGVKKNYFIEYTL